MTDHAPEPGQEQMRTAYHDVLVVGAGPTGLTATLVLAQSGIDAVTISRHPGPAHTPRAHITNRRTMEVFRDLGVEDQVRAVGYPLSWLHNNLFVTTLNGLELGRYKSYGASEDRLSDYALASPVGSVNCPQHVMEPALLEAARGHGAKVLYSHELESIRQTPEEVVAVVRNRESGERAEVHAKYVVGADGANSRVAQDLGFEFEGQAGLKGMANAWLEVDLTEFVERRPGVLYWSAVPGQVDSSFGTASWINVKPWTEWAVLFPWDADDLPPEDEVLRIATASIGDPTVKPRVKAITRWFVNNVVALEYRRGRVFLAGDAAHRHPPAGGLGTNTSVQDAYNLGWKLALVLKGAASPELLDSYDSERRPIGRQVVDRAISGWQNMAGLVEALGLRPGQTEDECWQTFREIFENSTTGLERRDQLAKAIDQQKYRSNALGVELGQRYADSSAVLDDGTPFPESDRDPDLYYDATTHPGAHLPHAWVEHEGTLVSTLDLVGRQRFALLTGIGGSEWIDAARQVEKALGIELAVHQIGFRCPVDDVNGEWQAVREVSEGGAILVRPDRHVAWRSQDMVAKPADVLTAAIARVLGRSAEVDAT